MNPSGEHRGGRHARSGSTGPAVTAPAARMADLAGAARAAGASGPAGAAEDARPARAASPASPAEAARAASSHLVLLHDITKTFAAGSQRVHALRGVSFEVSRGELVAVVGRSGSGKTTLLSIMAGLDWPTSGQLWFDGRELTGMGKEDLRTLRREQMALVFQSFALLPMLTAAENVGVPMRLARKPSAQREQRARDLLGLVGLAGREHLRPQEMSGGEQQRVAIARGLANNASLLLADEPTGQLDAATGAQIMMLLRKIVHAEGMTGIVATHDKALIDLADRVLTVRNGRLS
jgi:putative ABC transport system ATP-binding protein